MDRVFIEGLEVDTVIGAYDWEREIRQCLRLDLSFAWDNRKPAANDDLSLALDYATVSARIQAFAQDAQFILVETFAERLAALTQEQRIRAMGEGRRGQVDLLRTVLHGVQRRRRPA